MAILKPDQVLLPNDSIPHGRTLIRVSEGVNPNHRQLGMSRSEGSCQLSVASGQWSIVRDQKSEVSGASARRCVGLLLSIDSEKKTGERTVSLSRTMDTLGLLLEIKIEFAHQDPEVIGIGLVQSHEVPPIERKQRSFLSAGKYQHLRIGDRLIRLSRLLD